MILDEPLTGADPRQRVELIGLFDAMAANGCTVLVSSHVLYEVDDQAQAVTVLAVVGQRQNPRQIR